MMTLAGTPDGKDEIDVDMVSAYLHLVISSEDNEKDDVEYMPVVANQREERSV